MGENRLDEDSAAMVVALRHIALFVPDLQAAEQYYRSIFDMKLLGREALLNDGLWYTLSFDKSWGDAEAAGIDLGMSALRKGNFVLALFRGEVMGTQIYAIGLTMAVDQIAGVRSRLPEDALIMEDGPSSLTFYDRYRIIWQISVPGSEFRVAGDYANRWLLR